MNTYKILTTLCGIWYLIINISFYYRYLYPVFLNSVGQGLKEVEPDPETRNVLHCVSNSQQVV